MILLTSGGYVSSDLVSEYGKIPSSFVPLKNLRLFEHQINFIKKNFDNRQIFMSIPNDYDIGESDRKILKNNEINVIKTDPNTSYGKSIYDCLNIISLKQEVVTILNGDTLFLKYNNTKSDDFAFIGLPDGNYNWDYCNDNKHIYLGLFSFSSKETFKKILKHNDYSLSLSLKEFSKKFTNYSLIKIKNEYWLDFGILNLYYTSKTKFTTERSFNTLLFNKYSVIKSGSYSDKLKAEANWYENIPKKFYRFIPRLWVVSQYDNNFSYEIENLYQPSLSELYIYSEHPTFVWQDIFKSLFEFTEICFSYKPDKSIHKNFSETYYSGKTYKRLSKTNINTEKKFTLNGKKVPSIKTILEDIDNSFNENSSKFESIIHGDFCFSNILYDFKLRTVKVIDPKGILNKKIVFTEISDTIFQNFLIQQLVFTIL